MRQIPSGLLEIVLVAGGTAHEVDANDGHAARDGRVKLEQAVRAREHIRALHDDDAIAVEDMRRQLREVAQVVGIEEAALAQLLLQLFL